MTIIAAMLVHGMLIYSRGAVSGQPYLHFGAVSRKAPDKELYRERCLKLGENIATKANAQLNRLPGDSTTQSP